MTAADLSDEDLASDIIFCRAVMDNDSKVSDVYIEHVDGTTVTLKDMLEEVARRTNDLFNH